VPALWTKGDWNAFFGFGTNILVNMLTVTALLRFVLKMPDSLVFGRILPARGLMMCLSTLYYAWLAYQLAKKTSRSDFAALPSGVSVPHMFIVTFVTMLPILLKTNDPIKAWEVRPRWRRGCYWKLTFSSVGSVFLSRANTLWGAPRIHGELVKLGFEVAQSTVARYICRSRLPASQGWRTLLHNHADGIAAVNLFVLPTVASRFFIALSSFVTDDGTGYRLV